MRTLWTFFGLGRAPFAPGTFGTLGGVAVAALALALPSGPAAHVTLALIAACLFFTGIALGNEAEKRGRKDPGEFVWDEVAGYLVTLIGHDLHARPVLVLGAAFVAFRAFDILKPWPVSACDRMGGGLGIMLDDIVAGLYANVSLWVLFALV